MEELGAYIIEISFYPFIHIFFFVYVLHILNFVFLTQMFYFINVSGLENRN
jgi:hypothetical protein